MFTKEKHHGFPCMNGKQCPEATLKQGTEGYCPAWRDTAFMETNIATGEERNMRGCFFDIAFRALEHTVRASNRPAAEMAELRQHVAGAVREGVENFFYKLDEDLIAQVLMQTAREKLPAPVAADTDETTSESS